MPRLGARLSPILIGRDDLLDLAERRIEEAAVGRRQFVLLAGESGIGKSRLLTAIDTKAQAAGFSTAGGFLAPQDRDVPAASMLDMARTMTRYEPWTQLGQQLLSLVDETMAAPQPRRRVLVLQAVDLITSSLNRPAMLAFDDLQWADDLSLEIIAELARAGRDLPLLLVGVYRTDELAPGALLREWRARLLTQRLAEEARLGPLTLEQTALMTTLILDTGLPAPRDVVAAVHERTDGVPLHIEELLGAMAEDERSDSRAIRAARVPDTLEDAILQRIRRLTPAAQLVARSGAVIGRCFVPEVLAGIMDVPRDSLDEPMRELLEEHVLEPPGLRGLYDFRHQVLREVLYRSLPEADRRRLHARAGEFGRELEGASEIHASLHYERAGMTAQAFRSALQGARIASRLSSHREAFELYRRAVDNLPRDVPPAEEAEILEAFSVEAAAVEEIDVCEWAAREARERYLRAGDSVAATAQLATLVGMLRRNARPAAERIARVNEAFQELRDVPPGSRVSSVRASLFVELAYAAIDGMQLDSARQAIRSGREAAHHAGEEEALLWLSSLEGTVESLDGQVEAGLERIASAAAAARARGFEDACVTAYRDASTVASRTMEYGRASALIDEGLRYADAIDQSHCAHVMAATGALVAWADGRWDDAIALGERALADRGCERAAIMARWPLGYVALGRGEPTAAQHLEAAEARAQACGAPDMILAASWGLAELSMLRGDHDSSIARTQGALDLARRTAERARFAPFVVTGARVRILAGRPAEAERWVREMESFSPGPSWRPVLEHAVGLASYAAGSTTAARAALERAVRAWDERGRTWESLWARLDLASCLLRMRRVVDATKMVAGVRLAADRLGSAPILGRVEELERLMRRHGSEAAPWHPLTIREFEVAGLIATGLTNAEIAAELSVSRRTIGAHVEHVLAKLGASRRTEIAGWVATVRPAPPPTSQGKDPVAALVAAGTHLP